MFPKNTETSVNLGCSQQSPLMAMIKNNFHSETQNLELFPLSDKKVELSFTGETISSDGGLLLLREVDNQLDLIGSMADCIQDHRDQRYISHTKKELLTQRVFQIAAGYEDCNDCNDLRSDTILKTCVGRLPQSEPELASQPTMSRLENSISHKELYHLGQLLVDQFVRSYNKDPEVIILDCDDTNNITYGQQELSLFNQYYHDYCYMPLHIYEGISGKLITTLLKPGRRTKQSNIASLLKKLIKQLKQQWPNTLIIIRGDSHFTSSDFMEWSDQQHEIGFITGLAGNKKLHKLAAITIQSAKREFKQYGTPVKRYHSFMYKAGSWIKDQKVVVKVEVSSQGTNIRYIVTNMVQFKAKGLYEKGYCARATCELRIKEHKLYLKSDRSSCKSFAANQFRLFLHSAAYILLHTLQKRSVKRNLIY